jgi:cystathionine beta-lyase
LSRLGEICLRHQVLIVSDEIHADFVYTGFKHEVFANLSPEFQASTITCTAPSKTFNLAGLQVSNILIANPEIRQALIREIDRTGFSQLNTMGLVASQVAYATGADWLQALLAYLAENLRFVREFLAARIPRIRLVEPQGTYLLWLDFTDSGLSETDRKHLIVNQAKLWLDAGSMFGAGGEHFERINIACPRQVLAQALQQLEAALSQL